MEVLVHAKLRYLKMSPKKVRLIVDAVRGLKVKEADAQLAFMNKAAARPVRKLLKSAIANAVNNFKAEESGLVIHEIKTDEGPTFKRWRARARGTAAPIRKRSSHVHIILKGEAPEKVENVKAKAEPKAEETKEEKK